MSSPPALILAAICVTLTCNMPVPAQYEAIRLAADGEPVRFARIADIPRPLRAAIDRAECPLLDSILAQTPTVIFQPSSSHRVMAIVPCDALITYSLAFVFERTTEDVPRLVMFPVVAPSGGFTAADSPGLITWDAAAKTLTAIVENDYCGVRETRHTYQYGDGSLNGFTLVKVEHRKQMCESEAPWEPVWEAQPWPRLQ